MDKKKQEDFKDKGQDQVKKDLEEVEGKTEVLNESLDEDLREKENTEKDQGQTRIISEDGQDLIKVDDKPEDTKSETRLLDEKDQEKIKESYDQEIGVKDEVEEDEIKEYGGDEEDLVTTILAAVGNVAFSLFLILLIAVIGLNALSFAKGEDVEVFGKKVFIVGEDSMAPVIKKNDAIIVEDLPSKSINQGDLIVYKNTDGKAITAWVNNVLEDDSFEIKKDINSKDSIIVDGIAIVGRAETSIANLGDFIDFMSNPISLLIILFVGIIIYVIVWFVSNKAKKEAQA